MGADAAAGFDGRRGFLYGEKRHRQVDILGFQPTRDARGNELTLAGLVDERFRRSEIRGWRIVGVAVRPGDLERGRETLLPGLVAGDIVVAARPAPRAASPDAGPERDSAIRILVHRGDCFAEIQSAIPPGSGF